MAERPGSTVRGAGVAVTLYALVVVLMLLQQPGATTYDTRAELTQRPGDFLAGAFRLWHPESNFGEFQNQAYGYLFPQGTWFWLSDLLGVPDWIGQRLWSALIIIVACEGARRLARAIGLADLPALLAGAVFALSPRLLGTVTVQTAESLPGAVMPWLVLAVVLHLRGRLTGRQAALLSGAAVVCMGGVNAVETAACLPLAVILVVWGARRRMTTWRFAAWWGGAVAAGCLWWTLPLLVLARFAPPFFEYVESARDTTSLIGWSEASRGDSSWLGYLLAGDRPWWPAAFDLATDPLLVVVAALVAGVGLAGLALMDTPVRRPLVLALLLGLGCLTIAHGGPAGTPLADGMRALLDGPLQIFRNVHKIDPVVRLPLALGFGTAVAVLVERVVAARPRLEPGRGALLLAPLLLVALLGQPFLGSATRTPGWTEIAEPWQQARDYLVAQRRDEDPAQGDRTLVVPGSSFAQQAWGWTLDEPLAILGGVDVVSRTQVPLVPGESIRYLSALDQAIATGRVTPALVDELARVGIGHVVLRRDLLRGITRSPHPGGAAVSLAHAGLASVAGFGETDTGEPEVEVFQVPRRLPLVRATAVDDVRTVRGAPESVLLGQSTGVIEADQPTVLEGEAGWKRPADVVTDSNQRRERAFGNNDEGLSALMTATEPWRVDRAAHDFPAGPDEPPVVARYDGLTGLEASSAQGYADNFGPVTPASGPYAAIDGDIDTRWISSAATEPGRQWIRLDLDGPRAVHTVTITPVAADSQVVPIRTLEVVAGEQRVRARVGASGAPVVVRLDGRPVRSIKVRVVAAATAARTARIGIRELAVDGLQPRRTFALPGEVGAGASVAFGATPSRRACFITLTTPDCDVTRIRQPEEGGGLDRSFEAAGAAGVRITGHVVARSTPETARLLDQVERRPPVGATSIYGNDPKVAPRFAYDGQPTTAWVSDDGDLYPTLTFSWRRLRTITSIAVRGGSDQAPVAAVLSSGKRVQRVRLGGDGPVDIKPLRTRNLQIRFEKAPGAGRVVVPEIELGGVRLTRPVLADTPTGAVCGYGPNIRLGGRTVPTRVSGTMADLINGTPLRFESCGESASVPLGSGPQRLQIEPTAEFELLDAAVVPDSSVPSAPTTRTVGIERWGDARRSVTVGGGPAALLSLPENFNPGWIAELDGKELTPIRVDGWQQGWLLPAGTGTARVELRYGPERTYDVVLPLGLAVSGGTLLAGALCLGWLLLRRRRAPLPDLAPWPPDVLGTRAPWWAAALAATLVLLGPVAGIGLLAGTWFRRSWTRSRAVIAVAVLLAASGGLDALGGGRFVAGTADVAAALAVGLLAGLTLGRPARRRPHQHVAEGSR
ncbi:alpha-(1-_3)-arabinofuranosyltransferase [Pimelobacter simplex]|uniref:alpha-(1->3)-arabinofuranosyltransferase n=1 Tax=Nocardioides simplex TaxID=2045 RepID=UPI00215065C3|nr:alpha-(1->3)-arabinofuranosyltransferase [Pimelobacter simplex]UUW87678.1 alpha-(1->3)-arabinofuranosyltransferase [Pimelobacter simplex]UUW97184.1 alpha-(1->3)-arabinofuranosyltransferase [Pimelobacter simplex]